MKLCPIAIAVSCRRCPIVKACPVKRIIGDYVDTPSRATHGQAKKRK